MRNGCNKKGNSTRLHIGIFVSILSVPAIAAHTVYKPHDIPLLDNRFRIDHKTKQVTFVLRHEKAKQLIVVIRPDGSKLYKKNHPDHVRGVSAKTQELITISNPTPGPWQVVAELSGKNRIQLLSGVNLTMSKIPESVYVGESLTVTAQLMNENKRVREPHLVKDVELSVSLLNDVDLTVGSAKKILLFKDDGQFYEKLPFDGSLTAHF